MIREIKKKQIILENRKPYKPDVADYITEMNLVDWVYSSMRLSGSGLSRENVARMLKGEFLIDATISDHTWVERYYNAIRYARDILEMKGDLSEKVLFQIYHVLCEGEPQYRRGNPVLLALGYNPPHSREVEGQMKLLFTWLYSDPYETNPLMKAAQLHNRIIEIYPFEENSEEMARFILYYFLLRQGFPPFSLGISEQEYNEMMISYLKNEDSRPFYQVVERAVFNKMEVLMQLTAME